MQRRSIIEYSLAGVKYNQVVAAQSMNDTGNHKSEAYPSRLNWRKNGTIMIIFSLLGPKSLRPANRLVGYENSSKKGKKKKNPKKKKKGIEQAPWPPCSRGPEEGHALFPLLGCTAGSVEHN